VALPRFGFVWQSVKIFQGRKIPLVGWGDPRSPPIPLVGYNATGGLGLKSHGWPVEKRGHTWFGLLIIKLDQIIKCTQQNTRASIYFHTKFIYGANN
jgi:hypothetical protein